MAQVSSGVVPVPTGTDLSNSYRWFSTCLLTILRDVPSLTYRMIRSIILGIQTGLNCVDGQVEGAGQ